MSDTRGKFYVFGLGLSRLAGLGFYMVLYIGKVYNIASFSHWKVLLKKSVGLCIIILNPFMLNSIYLKYSR